MPSFNEIFPVSRLYLLFQSHTGLGLSTKRRLSSSHRSTIEPWSCGDSAVPATGVLFHAMAIQEECHGYRSSPHAILLDVDRVLAPAAAGAWYVQRGMALDWSIAVIDPLRGSHGVGWRRTQPRELQFTSSFLSCKPSKKENGLCYIYD
ncbi:unnamed protein product [Triticum turgidum subsp. durum]|uniref:Uncharacterized protein n=1 Tax=Triticum turgidum subsp. durum TaxID=4567 RepID=A0A9R0ZWU2_TRITD|nr:unnamed protein product [Triticum turgidum subsp. durum]